jgi:hypothetical protein
MVFLKHGRNDGISVYVPKENMLDIQCEKYGEVAVDLT